MVLAGAAAVSAVVVILGFISFPLHHLAVFYGFFGPAVLSFTFAAIIMRIDDRERGIERGWRDIGIQVLMFMFGRCFSYPQPLLMLVLGFGTMILGAVAGNPARDPERQRGPEAHLARPQPNPPGAEKPKPAPPEKKFAKPKTPPPATQFAGLLAYWNFDEGAGNKAVDIQRKLEGTLQGGQWVPGIRGQAVEFNGTTGYLDPGPSKALNFAAKAPFTVACWVKTDDKAGTVFGFRSAPDGLTILNVRLVDSRLWAQVRQDGAVFYPSEVRSPAALLPDEWHHLALTRDAQGAIEFFQDGVSVGKQPNKDSAGSITTNLRAIAMEPQEQKTGFAAPDQRFLRGCVDEFCVFSRVLTAAEVAELAGRKP
jgi:hypothetical protein